MDQPHKSQNHSSNNGAEKAAYYHPTSPWTEAYQDAPSATDFANAHEQDAKRASEPMDFTSEMYQPTHDALSDIYNREV